MRCVEPKPALLVLVLVLLLVLLLVVAVLLVDVKSLLLLLLLPLPVDEPSTSLWCSFQKDLYLWKVARWTTTSWSFSAT